MLWGLKFLRNLHGASAAGDDLDIVVGIDIYFLHTFPVNPFFQEREACHILVEVFA